jgi:hypothetical protein
MQAKVPEIDQVMKHRIGVALWLVVLIVVEEFVVVLGVVVDEVLEEGRRLGIW